MCLTRITYKPSIAYLFTKFTYFYTRIIARHYFLLNAWMLAGMTDILSSHNHSMKLFSSILFIIYLYFK